MLIELNMTGGMQTEFCISNAYIDGTKPHQKHCVCVMTADMKLIQINYGFYKVSDQRNNFIQDEVYENLESILINVQRDTTISVCILFYCDVTLRSENNSNGMQQITVYSSQMLLLYMFRVTIPPIIRSTCAVYGRR